ncbi:hypothetical protein GCM10027194_07230 [Thalassiella azotivora]
MSPYHHATLRGLHTSVTAAAGAWRLIRTYTSQRTAEDRAAALADRFPDLTVTVTPDARVLARLVPGRRPLLPDGWRPGAVVLRREPLAVAP